MYIDFLFLISSAVMLFIGILYLLGYFSRDINDPKPERFYGISVLIPVWNEEKTIVNTLDALKSMKKNYKGKLEVVVVDNNSKDSSYNIVKAYIFKNKFVRVIKETKNQGKSYAFNKGIKYAKYDLIACVDADSYPSPDSLNHMIGYFDDKTVGAVTTKMTVKNPKKIVEHFQDIEYIYSNFLLSAYDALDSIYVTKGPLSIYRADVLKKIGGFWHPNITPTEDMEITFRIRKAGYIIRASKQAKVYTSVMPTWKRLFWQRIRWNRGSMVNFVLHRDMIVNPKYGFFGVVTMPLVTLTMFMITVLVYYCVTRFYNSIYLFFERLFYYIYYGQFPNLSIYLEGLFSKGLFVVPVLITLFIVIVFVWLGVNYLGFRESKEKLGIKRLVLLLVSPFFYLPCQVFFWVCAFIIQVFKGTSKWR
ncbi:MAG: hypothetical protein COT14_02535 [Candidatus Diapherotrites archaeon CG08_land_8_20_14_0_20_30_16]|nr:MAG: hypothetical protein COT14_02535 [Candidatus Diapherotrites archaeon CG08_land_8_20_14_0_20_30_16]